MNYLEKQYIYIMFDNQCNVNRKNECNNIEMNLQENTQLIIKSATKGRNVSFKHRYFVKKIEEEDIISFEKYILLGKNPASQIERKVYKCLSEVYPKKVRIQLFNLQLVLNTVCLSQPE